MSLEFEIWPSDALQRYVAFARDAARGRTTLSARAARGLAETARAEFVTWDRADVAGFIEEVLRTADIGVQPQQPAPRRRSPRAATRTRYPAKTLPDPLARMRLQDEHVEWNHPLGHLLVIGSDFTAHYVRCGERGIATRADPRVFDSRFHLSVASEENGTWRVVDANGRSSLQLIFGRSQLTTDGNSFRATEVDISDSRIAHGTAARQPATRRPFIILPVLGVDGVPPVESGWQRMMVDFSEHRTVARELMPDGSVWEYHLPGPTEPRAEVRPGIWFSNVRDIFERGQACLIDTPEREWVGRKVPDSGILLASEIYQGTVSYAVTTVMVLVPLSVVSDFHAAFRGPAAAACLSTHAESAASRPSQERPALPATTETTRQSPPFWALAPEEREVHDESGRPIFGIGPTEWALVTGERGGAYIIRHTDGRIGLLSETSGLLCGVKDHVWTS